MTRILFRNDRHIYLRSRELRIIKANNSPLSIFMNAKFPYDILTFEYGSPWGEKIETIVDLKLLARHLGTSVKEVIFEEYGYEKHYLDYNYLSMLLEMPFVKSLTFKRQELKEVAKMFDFIHREEPNSFLHKLERLKIYIREREVESLKDGLESIKQLIPSNTKIILMIESLSLCLSDDIKNCLSIIEIAQINNLNVDPATLSQTLLKAENLNCRVLNLKCLPEQSPYPCLEDLLNKLKNITNVKLECTVLPPLIEFPQIKKLSLHLKSAVRSLKPLEFLVNLETLDVVQDRLDECNFGHEPITLNKLKTFHFNSYIDCEECLNALINSFQNLKAINFSSSDCASLKSFKLFKNWPYLETLDLGIRECELDFKEFDDKQSPRVYLRELTIRSSIELSVTTDLLTKIGKLFPNIQRIRLESQNTRILFLEKFLRSVIPTCTSALSKLQSLKIFTGFYDGKIIMTDSSKENLAKYLDEHGYVLKVSVK